jgi:hypothetical protein
MKTIKTYNETQVKKKHAIKTSPLLSSDDAVDKKTLYNEIFDLFELGMKDLNAYQLRLKLAMFDSLYKDFTDTAITKMHKDYDWCFLTDNLQTEFDNITPELIDVSKDAFWKDRFHRYLLTTTTHNINPSYIGRTVRLLVIDKWKKEKYGKNYVLGFILLNSPLVYSMNRNQYFFKDFTPDKRDLVSLLNKHFISGSVIVPTQSFGRYLLGGKLMALLCTSQEVLDIWDKAYGNQSKTLVFETTSLYADLKANQVSQYDGLDRFLKKIGVTDSSKVLLYLPDGISQKINKIVSTFHQKWYKKTILTVAIANAPKQKIYKKFIQDEFLPYFKEHEPEKYNIIRQRLKNNEWSAHSRKNSYAFCPYTKEQTINVLSGKMKLEELLQQPKRVDNSHAEVVAYWRRKSARRLEKKKEEIIAARKTNTWNEFYTRQEMRHGPAWRIVR